MTTPYVSKKTQKYPQRHSVYKVSSIPQGKTYRSHNTQTFSYLRISLNPSTSPSSPNLTVRVPSLSTIRVTSNSSFSLFSRSSHYDSPWKTTPKQQILYHSPNHLSKWSSHNVFSLKQNQTKTIVSL